MGWAVTTDQAALDRSLESQTRAWLQAKTDAVTTAAIAGCPVGQPDRLGRARRFPRTLRDSITGEIVGNGLNMRGKITANTPYALAVHEGTRPHQITPTGSGYPLRFYWDAVGGEFRTGRVNHPGTTGQPFLRNAARQVLG